MPIYEYECSNCHHRFDFLQKINDAPLQLCPQCYKQSVVRLVSAPGFRLKGTGWYATDYKNNNNVPADSTQANSKVQTDTSTSKIETKPANKDSKTNDQTKTNL